MNTNIYKNLYTKVYKTIGSGNTLFGEEQHQALSGVVGSASLNPVHSCTPLNQQLLQIKRRKYDK